MSESGELIIEPKNGNPANACVFILHGLGADGHDFEPLVPAISLPEDADVRFIMPHAPRLPVTMNGGMVMPAWYDILSMDLGRRVDEVQLKKSAQRIHALIKEQIGQLLRVAWRKKPSRGPVFNHIGYTADALYLERDDEKIKINKEEK